MKRFPLCLAFVLAFTVFGCAGAKPLISKGEPLPAVIMADLPQPIATRTYAIASDPFQAPEFVGAWCEAFAKHPKSELEKPVAWGVVNGTPFVAHRNSNAYVYLDVPKGSAFRCLTHEATECEKLDQITTGSSFDGPYDRYVFRSYVKIRGEEFKSRTVAQLHALLVQWLGTEDIRTFFDVK